MSPAFVSPRQAAAFSVMVLLLLLSPLWVPGSALPPREQAYQTEGWGSGPFPWLRHVIFEEKGDIDIAFVGSSHIFRGIDTPHVQAALSKRLGRSATVRTIAWGGAGFDALYYIAKDLLDHRRVRMLVIYDENNFQNQRNIQGTAWFRFSEDAKDLSALSLTESSRFYLMSVLAMPRAFLGMVRPNLSAELSSSKPHEQETILNAPNPVTRLGSFPASVGFNHRLNTFDFAPYEPFAPPSGIRPQSAVFYSATTKDRFHFSEQGIPTWQAHFARMLAAMTARKGSHLVMLHIPETNELAQETIRERTFWPTSLQADLDMLGIPAVELFKGVAVSDVFKMFSDSHHLNKSGMEYFTQTITPSLLQIYEEKTTW